MLNIYIAHENGTYFANPIVYKCVYVDGGGAVAHRRPDPQKM